MKQHLPLHHHVLNVCGLAACWVLMCWAAMVLKPTRHGAQSSFHAGMPVAEQLGRLPSATSIEFFDAVFNLDCAVTSACRTDAPRRSRRLSAGCSWSRQKIPQLLSPSPVTTALLDATYIQRCSALYYRCARAGCGQWSWEGGRRGGASESGHEWFEVCSERGRVDTHTVHRTYILLGDEVVILKL